MQSVLAPLKVSKLAKAPPLRFQYCIECPVDGAVQRRFVGVLNKTGRQKLCRQQVPRTIRHVFDYFVFANPVLAIVCIKHSQFVAIGYRRNEGRSSEAQSCISGGTQICHRFTTQPSQLERIRGDDVRQRQKLIADGNGNVFRHIEPALITEDRIDHNERMRRGLPDFADGGCGNLHLFGAGEIAGQDRIELRE